jgi:hypothetical protein
MGIPSSSLLLHELSLSHPEHPVGADRKFVVMRHDHEGYTLLFVDPEEEIVDRFACMRIKIAGRFIGKYDIRFQHQCPRNRDTLLFSARELPGPVMNPRSEPDIGQYAPGSGGCFFPAHPPDEPGKHDVLDRRKFRQQMVELEHEPHPLVSKTREPSIIEAEHIDISVIDLARRRPVKRTQDMEERAFSDTRCTDNGEHFACPDVEIDPVKDREFHGTAQERLAELLNMDKRACYFFSPDVTASFTFSAFFSTVFAPSSICPLMFSALLPADLSRLPPPRRTNATAAKTRKTMINRTLFNVPTIGAIMTSL